MSKELRFRYELGESTTNSIQYLQRSITKSVEGQEKCLSELEIFVYMTFTKSTRRQVEGHPFEPLILWKDADLCNGKILEKMSRVAQAVLP